MVRNASVGKKATTAVLACALSVSLTPVAAYAGDDTDADGGGKAFQLSEDSGASSGKSGTGEGGSGESGSGEGGSGEGGSGESGSGESGSGESGSGEGGSGESGSGESGSGESGSGESGSGESGSGSGESGSGEGGSGSGESGSGESGSGESGSGSGESGSGESGSGSGEGGSGSGESGTGEGGSGEGGSGSGESGSGESGSGQGGSGESGSGESGSGQGSGEGGSEVVDEVVLDLADKSTVVTVADIHAGETPCVKVKFAGDKSARDISKDGAFEITFFGPDGSKTTEFDAVGTYKVRVAAASKDATTSAGEKVKGRTGLTMFKVEEKPASEEAVAPGASGNSGSGSSKESGTTGEAVSSGATGSSDSSGSTNTTSAKGGSSSSASSNSKDKESSTATTTTVKYGSGGTYHGGANGKVTYLGAVRLGSSGGVAQPGYVQRAAAGGAVAALGASIAAAGAEGGQAPVAYALDDAATDVSALVAKAEGAELLFWGGGTEIAPLYIWDVSTKGMTRDDAFGLDLKVTAAGNESAVMKGANGADATAFSVGQTGALPDGCKLFWRTSSVFFDGESVDVYRFDPATGEYDLVEAGAMADGGYVSFSPEQGGEYLIVEAGEGPATEKPAPAKVTELLVAEEAYAAEAAEPAVEEVASETPAASDATWAIPAALAAAVIAAGGVWAAMRRKLAAAAKAKK